MGLIYNPCCEFRLSPEGPVSQIHSPRIYVDGPQIFSDLLRSVQMLKREWVAESNGKLPHLFIPSKTAILFPEFAVKTYLWQNCSLGAWICSQKPALEQKTLTIITRVEFFLVLIHLLFRHKISEFRINCFKFAQYFAKISRLIFIIIRESFVTYASK